MNGQTNRAPAADTPAAASASQASRSWAEVRRELEAADRVILAARMQVDPVLQAAAQQQMEAEQAERAAARAWEKARPAREAEASYRLNTGSGLRPLELASPDAWPEPERFGSPPPPAFKADWVSGPVGDFAAALAENLQCPVDLTASLILGAASVAALGKVAVRVRPGWVEAAQLYVAAVLAPGERKSPAFSRVFRPVAEWERHTNEGRALAVAQSRAQRRLLEKSLAKATDKGDSAEVARLTSELVAFRDEAPVTLTVSDATAEACAVLAAANGGRLAIVSAEAGILETAAGRYSNGTGNFDFLLAGYSSEPLAIHRIGRDAIRIPSIRVSVVLATQPRVLAQLFANPDATGRGLPARFLLAVPPPMVGSRKIDVDAVPPELDRAYDAAIRAILEAPYPERPREMTLTPEAAAVFRAFQIELEERRKDDLKGLSDWGWASKVDGLTLRIAATLALLEDPHMSEINASQLRRAVSIARWAIEHARAASASMPAASGSEPAAQVLLEALRRSGKAVISTRDAHRLVQGKRAMFPNADAVRAALMALESRGWVRRGQYPERGESGAGRPSDPLWIITPRLNDVPPAAKTLPEPEEVTI